MRIDAGWIVGFGKADKLFRSVQPICTDFMFWLLWLLFSHWVELVKWVQGVIKASLWEWVIPKKKTVTHWDSPATSTPLTGLSMWLWCKKPLPMRALSHVLSLYSWLLTFHLDQLVLVFYLLSWCLWCQNLSSYFCCLNIMRSYNSDVIWFPVTYLQLSGPYVITWGLAWGSSLKRLTPTEVDYCWRYSVLWATNLTEVILCQCSTPVWLLNISSNVCTFYFPI